MAPFLLPHSHFQLGSLCILLITQNQNNLSVASSMAAPAFALFFCALLVLVSYGPSEARKTPPPPQPGSALEEASSSSSSSPEGRRRELAGATARDVFAPVTNPVTVPATNPAGGGNGAVVTVPSTNPGGFTGSANPNLPPLYPDPTPAGSTTPFTTNPVTAPVTNPATTPAYPGSAPAVTNPATTYPGGGGAVAGTPAPATTFPPAVGTVAPAMGGAGAWCVAKAGVMEAALQSGIDYACGMGGADCTALQPMGSCYNPNTLQAHASYAFNAYFQRNPSAASCDFGGAGMLVSTNPSSGACMYQTSSGYTSGAGYSPTTPMTGTTPAGMTPGYGMPGYGPVGTGTGPAVSGGGSGSTVLNANNNPGGTSMYGPDNPTGFTGGDAATAAASVSCGWVLSLVWIFTFAYVKEKV